jgi:hypothetical protein
MLVCVLLFLVISRVVQAKIVQFNETKEVMLEHS